MTSYPSVSINAFLGLDSGRDSLDLLPGQLIKNENYLYDIDGSIYERGGGSLLSAAPSAGNPIYGLSNYKNNNNSEYLICVQGTDAYYYDSGWNALSLTLTSNQKMRFEMAGFGSGRALYGVNGSDSVIKISGAPPTAATVASSPTDATFIKLHKNRLFAIDGKDKLYFTDALAFDTWTTGTNFIYVSPGVDGYLQGLAVWGDALFIFKERGVYVLPNASDADPTSSWVILKTNASIGTVSPDTIKETDDGVYFLASDGYIRRINNTVSFSSGEYVLDNNGAPIVSYQIAQEMGEKIDYTNIQNATAINYKSKYIFSFQSIDNASAYNDYMYSLDVRKFTPSNQNIIDNASVAQPFTTKITGLDFNFMTLQTVGGEGTLYGAKGSNGQVHSSFDDSVHNDNSAPIVSDMRLAWISPSGKTMLKRLRKVVVNAYVENWYMDIKINAYKSGVIPLSGEGVQKTFPSITDTGSIVGTAVVGTATTGSVGQSINSFAYDMYLTGYYFTIQIGNSNANEFTRINSLIFYYEEIQNK